MATHRPVEAIKADSRRLRGSLVESLAEPATGALADDDTVLLKFHGSYQQDDRDLREERRRQKLEPDWRFMIRTRTPGGVLTPAQWLAMDAIARRYAGDALRLTTRQAVQFHGVIKHELKATLAAINAALIDTLAACGDVNRNVLVAANPLLSALHGAVFADAAALSESLLPRTRAYHEIWLDGEKLADSGSEEEPLYGPTYLPRKFKTAFAIPPRNDVDVLAHDLGFVAIVEGGGLSGYDVTVGGGMGASHGDPETFPLLARPLGFVTRGQVQAVAAAVLTTQRDFGNREQRKRARLKYTIEDRGLDWFREEVSRRAGIALAPPRGFDFIDSGDRYGWVEGEDGRWHLTLHLAAGRVADRGDARSLAGLAAIARRLGEAGRGEFRITPNQNLVVADVVAGLRDELDALVAAHGLDAHARLAPTPRAALACVALPTCGLAMAEAERWLPAIGARFQQLLEAHGLGAEEVVLRISGCPNGCSRPYLAEVALVGKGPGRYNLMLGGDGRGQRLARLHRENLDEAAILDTLDALLARWATERQPRERFGDFLVRVEAIDARDTEAA